MPEIIVFQDQNSREINVIGEGSKQSLPTFDSLTRHAHSSVQKIKAVSKSETHRFEGEIVVVPATGVSYSEDLQISSSQSLWGRRIPITIEPLGEYFSR